MCLKYYLNVNEEDFILLSFKGNDNKNRIFDVRFMVVFLLSILQVMFLVDMIIWGGGD